MPDEKEELRKLDLEALEALRIDVEGRLDAMILERNKKSAELKQLHEEHKAIAQHAREGSGTTEDLTDIIARKSRATDEQLVLNLSLEKLNWSLLYIRETVLAKKNPL